MLTLLLTLTARAEAPAEGGFSVVTVNAWGLPSPIARDRAGRLPRIARWLEEGGFDVAGLQEVWWGARRLLPLPIDLPGGREDSGLALRTPHAVSNLRLHTFRAERGIDAWKSKGVLVADVARGDDVVTVAVTHLQAGGGARNAAVRAAQVDEILGVLDDAGHPVVLLGDLNLYGGEPGDGRTHQRLVDAGFLDAAEAVGATGGTYPGCSDRFDRVFVQGDALEPVSAEVITAHDLSDHHPVRAQLRWAGGTR